MDELGRLTWEAIVSAFHLQDAAALVLGHRGGSFTTMTLVAAAVGSFEYTGTGEYPSEEELPKMDFSMIARFGGPSPA